MACVSIVGHGTANQDAPVHIGAVGDVEVTLSAASGDVATVRIADGIVTLRRLEDVVGDYEQTYRSPVLGEGPNEIVLDHGTLEVFAGDGATAMSALVFAGQRWTVEVDGEARLTRHLTSAAA